jgi:hypothetical protein
MNFNKEKIVEGFLSFYKNILRVNLNQKQLDNLSVLFNFIEADESWKKVEHLAYLLATVGHETAWSFAPIREYRAREGTNLRLVQDRYWNTQYYGRGYVQLTWKTNYEKFSQILGVNLVANPDLVLKPEISYQVLAHGMRKGVFTGKKLNDFINSSKKLYVYAIKFVNCN